MEESEIRIEYVAGGLLQLVYDPKNRDENGNIIPRLCESQNLKNVEQK